MGMGSSAIERVHEAVSIVHPFSGQEVEIDHDLVLLIGTLWSLGVDTSFSCEGGGPARLAYIAFPELEAAGAVAKALVPATQHRTEMHRHDEGSEWYSSEFGPPLGRWNLLIEATTTEWGVASVLRWQPSLTVLLTELALMTHWRLNDDH